MRVDGLNSRLAVSRVGQTLDPVRFGWFRLGLAPTLFERGLSDKTLWGTWCVKSHVLHWSDSVILILALLIPIRSVLSSSSSGTFTQRTHVYI